MAPVTDRHEEALQRIVESAQRLGVELDEADALQWLAAMTAAQQGDVVVDIASGTFGHRITMLDFSDEDLAHFRKIGKLVEFDDMLWILPPDETVGRSDDGDRYVGQFRNRFQNRLAKDGHDVDIVA